MSPSERIELMQGLEEACKLTRDGNVRLPNGFSVTAILRSIIEELTPSSLVRTQESLCEQDLLVIEESASHK